MLRLRFILILFLISLQARGEQPDALRIMGYNLLYYGINTGFCNSNNNNVDLKDRYLQTIFSYTLPDILAVNEMGRGSHNASRILENTINPALPGLYSHATYTNTRNTSLTNMLFYRHDKFALYREAVIANEIRDINLYGMYLHNEQLAHGDTTFVYFIVAHLKAGSSNSDQQARLFEVQQVMSYINTNNLRGNVIFMGDFNMKSSYESAYGHMTYHPDESIRFYDPINQPGIWIDNPEMTHYHTQSTRTGSYSCFVTGGMDDRFDQILVSRSILEGSLGLQYLEGSYVTVGQDGKRLNGSLIDPPNHSAPDSVIHALYNMSDHLPVYLELLSTELTIDVSETGELPSASLVTITGNKLTISAKNGQGNIQVRLFNIMGQLIFSGFDKVDSDYQRLHISIPDIVNGVYILQVFHEGRLINSEKLMVK